MEMEMEMEIHIDKFFKVNFINKKGGKRIR